MEGEEGATYEYERQLDFQELLPTLVGTSVDRRPDAVSLDYLTCFCPGPIALQDTSQGLLARPWRARFDGEDMVYLATNNDPGGGWGTEVPLDAPLSGIVEMDVAFTQNGDPTIAAEVDDGHIWIYWFDPLESAFVWQDFGLGRTPRIILDDVRTITGATDVQVFYISDVLGSAVHRQQRDRYDTIYEVPLEADENRYLEDVVTGKDRRLHIYYSTRDPDTGRYTIGHISSHPFPLVLDPENYGVVGSVSVGELQMVYFDYTADPASYGVSGSILSGSMVSILGEYELLGELGLTPSVLSLVITQIIFESVQEPASMEVTGSVSEGELVFVVFERTLDRADYGVAGSINSGVLETV